jgi:hypothetical protein
VNEPSVVTRIELGRFDSGGRNHRAVRVRFRRILELYQLHHSEHGGRLNSLVTAYPLRSVLAAVSIMRRPYTPLVTRYWAMRTDQARRDWIWSELRAGRLRQGWGYRPDLDLEQLAALRRQGVKLPKYQQDAWRGNRRLLPSQPDSMQVGDIVVSLHLPRYGVWSIARVTGGYRYEISTMGNAFDGSPDYGHIRDVELLTNERGIDPVREGGSKVLRHAMRQRQRMWCLDFHGDEIDRLLRGSGA